MNSTKTNCTWVTVFSSPLVYLDTLKSFHCFVFLEGSMRGRTSHLGPDAPPFGMPPIDKIRQPLSAACRAWTSLFDGPGNDWLASSNLLKRVLGISGTVSAAWDRVLLFFVELVFCLFVSPTPAVKRQTSAVARPSTKTDAASPLPLLRGRSSRYHRSKGTLPTP
jgi:hypothetical protein